MKEYPKISIITPSYNQGQYLEETILSVIGQNYPNLEYIIIDGGSSDNSVEIIKRYEKHLAYWTSEKDNGQSVAINKGFKLASGDILGWLNSDDMYLPGALYYVASYLDIYKPELIFGNCLHFNETSNRWWGSNVKIKHEVSNIFLSDYIIQPSSFLTKKMFLINGLLDENLTYAFDWDWYIRAKKANVNFKAHTKYLSIYRIHKAHKSATGGEMRLKELSLIYKKYLESKYEELFLKFCDHNSNINLARKVISQCKLKRLEIEILKFIFPKSLSSFSNNEISDVLSMTY